MYILVLFQNMFFMEKKVTIFLVFIFSIFNLYSQSKKDSKTNYQLIWEDNFLQVYGQKFHEVYTIGIIQ